MEEALMMWSPDPFTSSDLQKWGICRSCKRQKAAAAACVFGKQYILSLIIISLIPRAPWQQQ
jgi:hypothetical protein